MRRRSKGKLGTPQSRKARRFRRKAGSFISRVLVVAVSLVLLVIVGLKFKDKLIQEEAAPFLYSTFSNTENGPNNPRMLAVTNWLKAVQQQDIPAVYQFSDLEALRKILRVSSTFPWDHSSGRAKRLLEQKIINKLFDDEMGQILRAFKIMDAQFAEEEMARLDFGKVNLVLQGRRAELAQAQAKMTLTFRVMTKGKFMVYGWEDMDLPQAWSPTKPREARAKNVQPEKSTPNPQAGLPDSPPEPTVKNSEAPITAMAHLPDTPQELRQQIDQLLAQLMAPWSSAKIISRARLEMETIGKPAIPRLLNQIHLLGSSEENATNLALVVHILRDLSGESFGFKALQEAGSEFGASDAQRLSSLRQWFAWWSRVADRED